MKYFKHNFLVLVFISCLIVSCKKSESTPPSGPSLVGTWKYNGWSNKDCADPTLNPLGFACTNCTEVWTTSTITGSGWVNYSANYTVVGNAITFTNSTGDIHFPHSTYSGTFELTATSLTITIDATWTGCKMVKSYIR